jgi:hypothetical protein
MPVPLFDAGDGQVMEVSGRRAVCRPGREPVEITPGEMFRFEVEDASGLQLTRMEFRRGEPRGYYSVDGYPLDAEGGTTVTTELDRVEQRLSQGIRPTKQEVHDLLALARLHERRCGTCRHWVPQSYGAPVGVCGLTRQSLGHISREDDGMGQNCRGYITTDLQVCSAWVAR